MVTAVSVGFDARNWRVQWCSLVGWVLAYRYGGRVPVGFSDFMVSGRTVCFAVDRDITAVGDFWCCFHRG